MIYQVLLILFVAIGASVSDTAVFLLFHQARLQLEWNISRWYQVYTALVGNHLVAFAWLCIFVAIRKKWGDLKGLGKARDIEKRDIRLFCLVNAPLLIFVLLRLSITVLAQCGPWFPYRVLLGCPADVCGVAELLVPSVFELAHVSLLSVAVYEMSGCLALQRCSRKWLALVAAVILYQAYGVILSNRLAPVYWHVIGSAIVFLVWAVFWYSAESPKNPSPPAVC